MTRRALRVLLIRPTDKSGVVEFSLGMGYVARALLNAGFEVDTLCRDLDNVTDVIFKERIRTSDADIFAIGGMYGSFPDFIKICAELRNLKPNVPIVLGGALPTSSPEHVLAMTGADVACIGPAEDYVAELFEILATGGDASTIKDICLRDTDGAFHRTPVGTQPKLEKTGQKTWPAWEAFDGGAYTRGAAYHPFLPSDVIAPILTSRGCPYSCNFCFQPMAYRCRPLDDVFDEMEWLIERYGVTGFYLEDDLFMVDRKRVLAFCELLHKRNLKIKFTAPARFTIIYAPLPTALRDAGCVSLFFGGEVADEDTLARMRKKVTVDEMRDGVALTRDAGMFARVGFMFGQPGETRDTLSATVSFLKELAYGQFEPRLIYGCVPFPSTELFQHCLKNGLLRDEDDLYQRFTFGPHLLDQLPVNMTAIDDCNPKELLDAANRELLAFYQQKNPEWLRELGAELDPASPLFVK